jgi:hypothetical protein
MWPKPKEKAPSTLNQTQKEWIPGRSESGLAEGGAEGDMKLGSPKKQRESCRGQGGNPVGGENKSP